jgi:hypothetical protein
MHDIFLYQTFGLENPAQCINSNHGVANMFVELVQAIFELLLEKSKNEHLSNHRLG